jgi:hypothetical protein
MDHLGRQDSNLRMPVPKTGGLPLADVPSTQNYTDGDQDLKTTAFPPPLDAPTLDAQIRDVPSVPSEYDRFEPDLPETRIRHGSSPHGRRFAVADDDIIDFDDIEEDEMDDDEDEDDFEDTFADGDGGLKEAYYGRAPGAAGEAPSRNTIGLRNQSLSNS